MAFADPGAPITVATISPTPGTSMAPCAAGANRNAAYISNAYGLPAISIRARPRLQPTPARDHTPRRSTTGSATTAAPTKRRATMS